MLIYVHCCQLSRFKFRHFFVVKSTSLQNWGCGGGVKPILDLETACLCMCSLTGKTIHMVIREDGLCQSTKE